MLFDFQAFIAELRENEDKERKEAVEKYEKFFGKIEGVVKDQLWYEDYVSKFETIKYAVPKELEDEFEWDLLMQICASSFSSDFVLDTETKPLELNIFVNSDDQTVVRHVSELLSFQILSLFEIYIEEQINLQILIEEDKYEREAILFQRKEKLENWNKKIATVKSETEIDDLLGDL